MGIDLGQYQYVVMDSSIHKYVLEEELCEALGKLSKGTLCAASTFPSELRELSTFFLETEEAGIDDVNDRRGSNRALQCMVENVQRLRSHGVKPYIRRYNDYQIQDGNAHYDTWSLLNRLARECEANQGRILVLTANVMLIQMIRLSAFSDIVEIFPATEDWLNDPDSLSKIQAKTQITNEDITKEEELELYDEKGNKYSLKVNSEAQYDFGSEAKLYNVQGESDLLAKIYRQGCMSQQLQENILEMRRFHDEGLFPWVMLPCGLLYQSRLEPGADRSGDLIVGYLMKQIDTTLQFDRHRPFMQLEDDDKADLNYRDTLKLCRAVLRQILYLSSYGIFVVDDGRNNFAQYQEWYDSADEKCGVYFLDTCSFSYKSVYVGYQTGDLIPQFTYDVDTKEGLIRYFSELTYLFALQMLTGVIAVAPMGDKDGKAKKLNILDPESVKSGELFEKLVPPNIRDLTRGLYEGDVDGERHFSVEVLLEEVATAFYSFPEEGITYGALKPEEDDPDNEPYAFYESRTREDLLPCDRESKPKAVNTIIRNIREKTKKQKKTKKPEESEETEVPVEEPTEGEKLPFKVHHVSVGRSVPKHRSGFVKVDGKPVRPRNDKQPKGIRFKFHPVLVLLVLLGALLICDMLRFSADSLGFDLAAYFLSRWQAIVDCFRTIFRPLVQWFSGISPMGSRH